MHVGDLSHVLVEETPSELKANLLKAGRLVGSEVARLKLKLSDKSTILQINEITKSVATILTEENITLKVKATGDDVGIQMSAGGIRRASTLNNRIAKGGNVVQESKSS